MANLPELDEFTEGVYQWEVTDPAEAGPDGILNTPLKALTNRTLWLKNRVIGFFPRELKCIAGVSSGFITTNFPGGIGTGAFEDWFVANGANGTDDMGGKVPVGFGNGNVINDTGGAATVTLTLAQIPAHAHTISQQSSGQGGSGKVTVGGDGPEGSNPSTDNAGGGGSHENMPPYRVVLCIQYIPS